LKINVTPGVAALPEDFTFAFWFMYVEPDLTVDRYRAFNYEVVNAFGRVKVGMTRPGNVVQHRVGVEVVQNTQGVAENFLNTA
jgi:hypothetical protein